MYCHVIINPNAGQKRASKIAATVMEFWKNAGWQVECSYTNGWGHATMIAREVAQTRPDLVIACGGDGTLSEILQGLEGTGIPAGLLPAGTGNDLARTLGLSLNPMDMAQDLLNGQAVALDCMRVQETATQTERLSLNVTGLGFDAGVCERINLRKRCLGGKAAYLMAVAQQLISYRPTWVKITTDAGDWEGDTLLVAFANARSYGAGMQIAPLADMTDGLLDVVVVRYANRLEFMQAFHRLYKGTVLEHPKIKFWHAKQVQVETREPSPVLIDGDLLAHTPLDIRMEPKSVLIWLPEVDERGKKAKLPEMAKQ